MLECLEVEKAFVRSTDNGIDATLTGRSSFQVSLQPFRKVQGKLVEIQEVAIGDGACEHREGLCDPTGQRVN